MSELNLLSPEMRNDPYRFYAEMRQSAPVRQVEPGGMWVISRHEDAIFALKNPEIFSSSGFESFFEPPWVGRNPLARSLVTKDPPAHTRLRNLTNRAFLPRNIAALEPLTLQVAQEQAERLSSLGEADFVEEFAVPLPARVIAQVLGLDGALHSRFKAWVNALAWITPTPTSEEHAQFVKNGIAEMERYLKETIAAHRREPMNDMLGELLRAEVNGEALTDEEVLSFLFALLAAGFETTTNFFGKAMLAFIHRPDDYAKLREDPSRIPAFVEEQLRHDPVAQAISRKTTRDVEMGGVTIPANSMVMILLGSVNRDDSLFHNASGFDVSRDTSGSVAFGHGIHFCIGAPLARMEARIGIEVLTSRFKGFELLQKEITWIPSLLVHGPLNLKVRCIPA